MSNIKDQTTFVLTNTKLVITIAVPLVAAVGFFVSLKAGVEHNASDITESRAKIEKLEARMERMDDMLVENNTNIKLMQKDITIMMERMKEGR